VKLRGLAALCRRLSRARPESRPLTPSRLGALADETRRFVEDELGPQLAPDALNIVGFTMTFDQVYSSLFTARLLRETFPDRRLLFLFGGNSASLPPVATLFQRVGMRGFLVIGEGEKKLELVLRTALALAEDTGAQALDAAVRGAAPGIVHTFDDVNLHERNETFFATQFPAMEGLALPSYDDYFSTVRRLVLTDANFALAKQDIALLAEGSRGCFAHCDFCGQNATWSGFRTRSPQKVLADLLAQIERYQCTNIMFVDNVCDTWAERFATALLERGLRFPCFMEMRANHPERFWTRLALAGLQSAQIGIESVSAGLLRQIGKGVPVVRNLATQKYLLELGVTSLSNLIVGHPRATVDDIAETRRVLSVIPHFRLFDLSGFHLAAASPLYEGLRPEERRQLQPLVSTALPWRLRRHAMGNGYHLPASLRPPAAVDRAWRRFAAWHAEYRSRPDVQSAFVRVMRLSPHSVVVRDFRDGEFREWVLADEWAGVYDVCHRGVTLETIVRATGLPASRAAEIAGDLTARRLLLHFDGHYLSIALRPRDELVERTRAQESTARPADRGRGAESNVALPLQLTTLTDRDQPGVHNSHSQERLP
jgi:hypothetical protein